MNDDMRWNLEPMVEGADPSQVKEMIDTTRTEIEVHYKEFGDRLPSLSSKELIDLFDEIDFLGIKARDLISYCALKYYTDTTDKIGNQLYSWGNEFRSQLRATVNVFELKLGKMLQERSELLNSDDLFEIRHYLERIVAQVPYMLSELEETLTSAKDVNGIYMIERLRESWLSQKTFEVDIHGEKKTLTYPQLSSLRMDPDPVIREMASYTQYKSIADDKLIHSIALQSICADHVTMAERRNMPSPMTKSLLDQDVEESAIEALLSTIEETSSGFQKFLKIKAKFIGDSDKIKGFNVIAPWRKDPVWKFEYSSARKIVIDSFNTFDNELAKVVEGMFTGHRIDAENRVGKPSTAFCMGWPGAKNTFVFINYNNTLNDTATLAHELGHSAQTHLIYHTQRPTNWGASSCMAECGSIFGELLLADKILSMSETDEQRIEALSNTLNDFYYTVYYVGTRALFEKTLYKAIHDGKLLDSDLACDLWNAAKKRTFGDAVEWSEYMEYEWARIPHFFFPNYRYYNYSYSFAQMLVYGIYEEYQKGAGDFADRFKTLLGAGFSKSPKDQIADFGYDLNDPGFWKLGPKNAERLLSELKKLV
jgi:oligoendopeptidase F